MLRSSLPGYSRNLGHRDALGYDYTQATMNVALAEFGGEARFMGAGLVSALSETNRLSLAFV